MSQKGNFNYREVLTFLYVRIEKYETNNNAANIKNIMFKHKSGVKNERCILAGLQKKHQSRDYLEKNE